MKAPRWTIAFLRALARTGDVRAAAEDAGVDHSTAYARRRAHPEFAGLWRGALAAHALLRKREEAEELEAIEAGVLHLAPSPSHGCAAGPSLSLEGRGTKGAQLRRVGHDRWSAAKEKAFFDELAATANVKRAAAAAGVSPNAVYARRTKHPAFRAKWAAVLETGRASIEMHLVEAANRTFDPDRLDTGEVEPRVSVAEAIRIVQVHGSRKQQEELPDPFAEQAAAMTGDEVAELRERLVRKLRRMRDRDMPDRIAEGWSFDEEFDQMVPPGWVRGPDCPPEPPEE